MVGLDRVLWKYHERSLTPPEKRFFSNTDAHFEQFSFVKPNQVTTELRTETFRSMTNKFL